MAGHGGKREAWRLNALQLNEREAVRGEDLPMDPVDPRDRHAEAFEFRAAVDELKELPPLLQEVVVMHSQANRHSYQRAERAIADVVESRERRKNGAQREG